MDKSEKLIRDYLAHQGLKNIVYEPDGKVPPDFLVDGRIAVEVRRLNQNENTSSRPRGLEEVRRPLERVVRNVLSSMGPPTDKSWYVWYSFRRPLPPWKQLKEAMKINLTDFMRLRSRELTRMKISDKLRIRLEPAGKKYPAFFVLGGFTDLDSGGFILAEIKKNLRVCIEEKAKKVDSVRHKYLEWWLALADYIGYGLDEDDRRELRVLIQPDRRWDKIILVNPLNPTQGFEL